MAGYATCGLCGRKKSLGILSSGTWGSVSADETTVQACPTCMDAYPDWETRLQGAAGGSPELSPRA